MLGHQLPGRRQLVGFDRSRKGQPHPAPNLGIDLAGMLPLEPFGEFLRTAAA